MHGHVQRRDRLIRHHQARVERQGARNANALTLTAAERVRVARHIFGSQANQSQQFRHVILALGLGPHPVNIQRFTDNLKDRHARVERPERILEDHLHLRAEAAHFTPVKRCQVGYSVICLTEKDFAAGWVNGA